MFLSCSLLDKWAVVRKTAAFACPSWLGVSRQWTEFGDQPVWMLLWKRVRNGNLEGKNTWKLHTLLFSSKNTLGNGKDARS